MILVYRLLQHANMDGCSEARFMEISKGSYLFWEKEWGSINSQSYCGWIVPTIDGYMRLMKNDNYHLQLMQDGASGHVSSETTEELCSHLIFPISWPPFSSDLNPIEAIWNWMKNWFQKYYSDDNLINNYHMINCGR